MSGVSQPGPCGTSADRNWQAPSPLTLCRRSPRASARRSITVHWSTPTTRCFRWHRLVSGEGAGGDFGGGDGGSCRGFFAAASAAWAPALAPALAAARAFARAARASAGVGCAALALAASSRAGSGLDGASASSASAPATVSASASNCSCCCRSCSQRLEGHRERQDIFSTVYFVVFAARWVPGCPVS